MRISIILLQGGTAASTPPTSLDLRNISTLLGIDAKMVLLCAPVIQKNTAVIKLPFSVGNMQSEESLMYDKGCKTAGLACDFIPNKYLIKRHLFSQVDVAEELKVN